MSPDEVTEAIRPLKLFQLSQLARFDVYGTDLYLPARKMIDERLEIARYVLTEGGLSELQVDMAIANGHMNCYRSWPH